MVVTEGATEARRTRLSAEREAELYAAVVELLGEVGYEALTMPAVATRARSSTATLYRQWGGKPGLVVAALHYHRPAPDALDVDTGSLRGDLHGIARRVGEIGPADHSLMAGLAHVALNDAALARALREQLAQPAEEGLERILERAVARGEIPADTPARGYITHLMVTISFIGPMMDGTPIGQDYLPKFVDAVVLPALRQSAS